MIGKLIAHYEVLALIGRGGMGEVYRAHDTVLGRDVALKILPQEFAADADRMARFQREAKLLASLNHPNIASIFGFEHTPECTFLVMELVEGEDLSEVLKRGAVTVDEAVDIARQIAEGLEEAHEKGIIHRDLKPANVKRTPEGKVKVLDFGLARALSGQTAVEEHVSSAPTMTAAMTQTGTVLGTAAYMSPEQARGKEVDRRTDIWAFGVLLFEMLTGKQLFAGETASDTLAGILKTEPDWDDLPDDLPPQVERVLRRCLSKDPRQRLRDIGEARVRLENPGAESGILTGAISAVSLPDDKPRTALLPWAVTVVAIAAALWFALGTGKQDIDARLMHLAIAAPEDAVFNVEGSYPGLPAISPDGRHIVFSGKSVEDGSVQLYIRAIDADQSVALDRTKNAQYPFWAPDGQWIGFYDRDEGLKKIMIGGGPAQTICPAPNGKGGSWNEAGQIIFTPEYNAAIYVVPAVGGEPKQITKLESDEGFDSHRHPQFLPDGRRFLYLARGAGGRDSELRIGDLDGSDPIVVMKVSTAAQYASGYLLYLNQQTLMAQPFDPDTGTLSGTPATVIDDVMIITGAAKGSFCASDQGTIIYLRGMANFEAGLNWVDRKGNILGPVGDQANYNSVALSPDDSRVAVTIIDAQAGTGDIWIVEIERNFRTRFTNTPADELYPVWINGGNSLMFVSDRSGKYAVYRQDIGGTGETELVLELPTAIFLWDCSADGRTILYSTIGEDSALDLWAADVTGQEEPRLIRRTPADDGAANFSPDGRWISFWSEESGSGQVYLAPWPAMTPISQVSTATGGWSFWNSKGTELIYQDQTGRLLSAPLGFEGGRMNIGVPEPMFDHGSVQLEGALLDLAADNERFLAVSSIAMDPPSYCDVLLNWTTKLEQP